MFGSIKEVVICRLVRKYKRENIIENYKEFFSERTYLFPPSLLSTSIRIVSTIKSYPTN
jgi:hypothetical protein